MKHRVTLLAVMFAGATVASAQMPPSISKPIEQARKAADATNRQTSAVTGQAIKPVPPAFKQATPPAAQSQAKGVAAPSKGGSVKPGQAPAAAMAPAPRPQAAAEDTNKITFQREVFTYVPREIDPFTSPIESGAIRPLVADLRLVGVIYDPAGRNSVAVLRDMSIQPPQQYRAKIGQMLGRAKVAQIKPQEIVLSIEEYGFSRQEIIKLNTQQTQQTKGKP